MSNVLDIELDFTGFDYSNYRKGEKEILQPQLEALGYIIKQWYTSDSDSFGPLMRGAKLTNGMVYFYG